MSENHFDHLARLLAQGTSRRQILKGFAAGLGASLFSTFNLGSTPDRQQIAQAATPAVSTNGSYLPYVISTLAGPAICSVGSQCRKNIECSANEEDECRCIETAEGDVRCGEVPPCGSQTCTTSADCSNLGADYFCDSVGSGCCGTQLCIAPCKGEAACPAEQLCGAQCCPPRTFCEKDACIDNVGGTWTGTLTYEGQQVGIQFILTRDFTTIGGSVLLEDPVSKKYQEAGTVTGVYGDDKNSTFQLLTNSRATGIFGQHDFSGNFHFVSHNGEAGFNTTIALLRTA